MVSFLVFVVITIFLLIVAVNFAAIFARIEDFPYGFLSNKERKWYKYFERHPKVYKRLYTFVKIYIVLWCLMFVAGIVFRWICDALHLT